MTSEKDIKHMKAALSLARRGLGRCAPNPAVGCVIVKNGVVIARARTADGGRPHAEAIALEMAGDQAKGATLYATLEPCSHQGGTPPCTQAIIDSGVKRVVIGTLDVDPRVKGKSIKIMQESGIDVVQGVCEEECRQMHLGFINRITKNRPYVTIKTACTIDGKVASASGDSQWITGERARHHVHMIRSQHDAILIGVGTAIVDNPRLTTRVDGIEHNPVRIVLDSNMSIDPKSRLVQSAKETPLWVLYSEDGPNKKTLEDAGVILHQVDCYDIEEILRLLADEGINRVLIEGGAQVHGSFLREGHFDELLLYRAPSLLGGDGMSFTAHLEIFTLAERHNFVRIGEQVLGDDILERYRPLKDMGAM